MHYKELIETLQPIFKKIGYRKNGHNWFSETQELVIILSPKVDDKEKDFYIDIGLMFKKLHSKSAIKRPVFHKYEIAQGLYNLLYYSGEWEPYLNNLFCYNPDINTDAEIANNCMELAKLYRMKVVPFIQKIDSMAWLVEDFDEEEAWKPFLKYFRAHPDWDYYFYGVLERYYRESFYRNKYYRE
ncbi:MAG TPA: DUF4304 domain-containing protein [Niastella sp.]